MIALMFFLASLFRNPPNRAKKVATYTGGEHGQ